MKRVGFLFEKAFTLDSLLGAFKKASKHKHSTRACFNFEINLAFNIQSLYEELHNGTYKPQPYYSFRIYEPKSRIIYAPAFRDLVVQHAIYAVVGPMFEKSFIDQSYACRVGYGTHKAADYAQQVLRNIPRNSYNLKLDIRKFFYTIDRTILQILIARKIKDSRFVNLMLLFADYGEPLGIPIGNLLSQLYALIYLNPLDHFIKRNLKVKYYCRYVDDFILFGLNKEKLIEYKSYIILLLEIFKLKLSKFTLSSMKKGINFVGYRTWSSKRFIRKHSLYVFNKFLKKNNKEGIVSSLGHALKTGSLRYMLKTIKESYNAYYLQLPKVYRQFYNKIHQVT